MIILKIIGNLIWLLCGGFIEGIIWFLAGLLWCITIIGIPIGKQCFKFSKLSMCPFGKEVVYGDGTFSMIANIFWILITGIPMAIYNVICGIILCITIIGIPFGKQFFKLAKLSIMPFGARIVNVD